MYLFGRGHFIYASFPFELPQGADVCAVIIYPMIAVLLLNNVPAITESKSHIFGFVNYSWSITVNKQWVPLFCQFYHSSLHLLDFTSNINIVFSRLQLQRIHCLNHLRAINTKGDLADIPTILPR